MYRQDGPEAERSPGETEFVAGQAAMSDSRSFGNTRACTIMFGNIDMTMGDKIEPLFDRHMEWSGGRFRGLRYSTGWDADERIRNVTSDAGMLVSVPVKDAAGVLARRGLSLDSWLNHPQLDEVAALADAISDLAIVLNHVGNPILGGPYRGQKDEVFVDWRERTCCWGARDDIYVKLCTLPIRMPDFQGGPEPTTGLERSRGGMVAVDRDLH